MLSEYVLKLLNRDLRYKVVFCNKLQKKKISNNLRGTEYMVIAELVKLSFLNIFDYITLAKNIDKCSR